MFPILFSYQDFNIYSLGALLVVGFILFNVMVVQVSALKKLNIKFWNSHIFSLSLVTILASRLLFIGTHWERYQDSWSMMLVPDGFSFYGGMMAFVLLLYFYTRKHQEDFLVWCDVFTISFFVFLICSGVGHFLDGSNYGLPTDLPWGMTFDNIFSPVEYTVPIHPTQLYEALYAFLILIVLFFFFSQSKFKGLVTFMGGFLLGTCHFFLSYLYGETTLMVGILRLDQLLDLMLIAICGGMLFSFLLKKHEL